MRSFWQWRYKMRAEKRLQEALALQAEQPPSTVFWWVETLSDVEEFRMWFTDGRMVTSFAKAAEMVRMLHEALNDGDESLEDYEAAGFPLLVTVQLIDDEEEEREYRLAVPCVRRLEKALRVAVEQRGGGTVDAS